MFVLGGIKQSVYLNYVWEGFKGKGEGLNPPSLFGGLFPKRGKIGGFMITFKSLHIIENINNRGNGFVIQFYFIFPLLPLDLIILH